MVHWWGFISRNYVVWPIFFLMNLFIALKGTHFLSLFTTKLHMFSLTLHLVLMFFSPILSCSSLGEVWAGPCVSRAFVCLSCIRYFFVFLYSSWWPGWLRIVIVTLPEPFIFLFDFPFLYEIYIQSSCRLTLFWHKWQDEIWDLFLAFP